MDAIRLFWQSLVDQYRKGISLFWLGPMVVALVVLPEFMQHVAEIQLGMFDSRTAARSLAQDPTRWAFGYAKLAGLVLTFFAAARFWWCSVHGGRWYDLRQISWGKFLLGFLLYIVVGFLAEPLVGRVSEPVLLTLRITASLASLPFLFVTLAGFFGDGAVTFNAAFRYSWPYAVLLAILLVLGFGPAQLLHGYNHKLAIGAPLPLVWALMIFDSLVVGLLASLVGAGIALSYMAFRNRVTSKSM